MNLTHYFFLLMVCTAGLFADCASDAKIERPEELPHYPTCTRMDKSGCRGWEVLGAPLLPEDLVITSDPARLFVWESGHTVCLLFKRDADETGLNGTHCYNRNNCDVCAYDGRGTEFNKLVEGKQVTDNCSQCHLAGPTLPKGKIWSYAYHITKEINEVCAKRGGPRWVNAPDKWLQSDLKRRVSAPKTCLNCHSYFVKGGGCDQIKIALESPSGSMKKYRFDLTTKEGVNECLKFSKDMECSLTCSP